MISLHLDIADIVTGLVKNSDHAEAIADAYPEHTIEADYNYSAGSDAVLWPNDKAHPGDPEEIEIIFNADDEAMKIIAEITNKVRMEAHKISDALFPLYLGLVDHLNTLQGSEEAAELVREAESAKADDYDDRDEDNNIGAWEQTCSMRDHNAA